MANYDVTTWVSTVAPLVDVATELETYINTVDDSKTIRSIDFIPVGSNSQAIIIHDD